MYLMPYDKELLNLDDKKGAEEVKEVKKETKGVSPSVARRIRFYLREHGISQRALAEKMGNISQGQLSHCLLGRYTLTRERVDEICKALEITYEELMGVSGESSEPMVDAGSEEVKEDAKKPEIIFGDHGDIDHRELDKAIRMVEEAETMVNTGSEEAEDGVIEETKNDPIDEALKDINAVATAALEEVEETKKEDDGKGIEKLKADHLAQLEALSRSYEDALERMRFIQTATLSPAKEPHPHQRLVDELKRAAETIIKNAESMIGTEKSLGDVQVTIYLRPHEVPRINVDKDVYPEY